MEWDGMDDDVAVDDGNAKVLESTALRILRGRGGWVAWDASRDCPDWQMGTIALDGRFSVDELRALMRFARRNG